MKKLILPLLALVLWTGLSSFRPASAEAPALKAPPLRYFTIQVLACGAPYPGVPVDVLRPDGTYLNEVSDANGKVIVNGSAGTYDIFATDGWSYQSTSFTWDGKGRTQVKTVTLDC